MLIDADWFWEIPKSVGKHPRPLDVKFYPHHNHHEVAAMKVELESEAENTRGKVKTETSRLI